jgi:hypothetical protein
MRNLFNITIIFLIISFSQILAQETNVTIYNDNLGVVKEVRKVNLKKGVSKIRITDVPSQIDPTSVHLKFSGKVLEQNYKYDLADMGTILSKYIDKQVSASDNKGETISGKLLSAQGGRLVLQQKDGGLLMIPDYKNYSISVNKLPDGLITMPTLEYLVKSKLQGKSSVELSYLTSGMSWNAQYVLVLSEDESKLNLNSWVSITNQSGATFNNAKLKLVAGDINRARSNEPQPVYMTAKRYDSNQEQAFEGRSFFEYHIYDLKRKTTLANNEKKQIAFISAANIGATKIYRFSSYLYEEKEKENVEVEINFENNKQNNLGVPLPAGKVRLFKKDKESLELIGEDMINHTPKDEKIKLKVGKAFDVLATAKNLKREKISSDVDELTRAVTIFNHKDKSITVEVEQKLAGNWQLISTDFDFVKTDANTALFKIPVPANGKTKLGMTIRLTREHR